MKSYRKKLATLTAKHTGLVCKMVVNVHSTHVETKTVLESKNLRVDPGYIGQKKNDP